MLGAAQGPVAIASVAVGLAAQPGSPINNAISNGLRNLLGKSTIVLSIAIIKINKSVLRH